jgi:predicted metal-dependent TIM-barrel fold hydrolase
MILDMLRDERRISPERVCIDHVEEHTIRPALEAGHWVGMTLYPITKCTPARAADMVEIYGAERVLVNSAGDWGHSDPLAVPEFIYQMRARGHAEATIGKVVYGNPLQFFAQCRRFHFKPREEAAAPLGR